MIFLRVMDIIINSLDLLIIVYKEFLTLFISFALSSPGMEKVTILSK